VDQLVTAFVQGLESTKSHTFVLLLVAYTLLEWAIIAGCYICLFRAFPQTAHFAFIDVLVFLGFVALGSSLQIPGIGGGMQVVSVLVLTELYGLGLEAATGVTLLVWMVTWVVIVPVGLILSFTEGFQWSKLRRVERENAA
jgi:glycosyltransferase 2 family protein